MVFFVWLWQFFTRIFFLAFHDSDALITIVPEFSFRIYP